MRIVIISSGIVTAEYYVRIGVRLVCVSINYVFYNALQLRDTKELKKQPQNIESIKTPNILSPFRLSTTS